MNFRPTWSVLAASWVVQLSIMLFGLVARLCGPTKTSTTDIAAARVLFSVSTNGLGHVFQLIRVLSYLRSSGVSEPFRVAVGSASKLPTALVARLKELNVAMVDLRCEPNYEAIEGEECIRNNRIAATGLMKGLRRGIAIISRIVDMFESSRSHRPLAVVSFFEPCVPAIVGTLYRGVQIFQIASQGLLLTDTLASDDFLFQMLMSMCTGFQRVELWDTKLHVCTARLIPLSPDPAASGAMPQLLSFAEQTCCRAEPFFVAYSTHEATLAPQISRLRRPTFFFCRHHKRWKKWFRDRNCANITVRPVSSDFSSLLVRAAGLVCHPSRGVVTQAVAAGVPVFLDEPLKYHLEQEFNLRFYMKHFRGLATQFQHGHIAESRYAGAQPKEGYSVDICQWEDSAWAIASRFGDRDTLLVSQAKRVRDWLGTADQHLCRLSGQLPI